jgi:hypothetical protein
MKKIFVNSLYILMLTAVVVACKKKKDDPKPEDPHQHNDSELVTTLKLILTEEGTTNETVFIFRDLDGDGGNLPEIIAPTLKANTTYHGELVLLDETKSPAEDISEEVKEEGDEHQFFFEVTGAELTHSYIASDVDANGVPVGLYPKFVTGAASTGTLKVILKHQHDVKPVSGNGDSSKGETDIEVEFNISIL